MSHQSNVDHDEMAYEQGQERGHADAMQEVLGKLRLEHENLSAIIDMDASKLPKTVYECCFFQRGLVRSLIKDLFGEDEHKRLF